MRAVWTIFGREIRSYFNSPIAYLFSAVYAGLSCGLFVLIWAFPSGLADMRSFFELQPILLGVFLPALSMRLWAEERRQGTIELLMTFPMHSSQLVLGKFLGAFCFYVFSVALTGGTPFLFVVLWGAEPGPILGGYFGSIFAGGVFIAAGMFFSSLTKDQLVAFILNLLLCLGVLVLAGWDALVEGINGVLPGLGSFIREGLMISPHFNSIERGVIDLRDLVYFASYTGLFLLLNYYVLESHVKYHARATATLAALLAFGVTFSLNLNVSLWRLGRFDLTEGGRYTVSPASVELLKGLKAPIEVTVYLTTRDKLPEEMKTMERDIVDFLSELKAETDKIVYRVVDPAADREQETKLNEGGIKAFQVVAGRARATEFKLVYATMQIEYLSKRERLEHLLPGRLATLEIDLMMLVHRMAMEKEPHVAVFAPYLEPSPMERQIAEMMRRPLPPPRDLYSTVGRLLREQGYRVTRIRLNSLETIPEDADALLIFSPQDLNERQKHEINRFLRSGKSVLYGVQTHAFKFTATRRGEIVAEAAKAEGIGGDLLKAWGVEVDDRILMDESRFQLQLQMQSDFPVAVPISFPNQIEILEDTINSEHPITKQLSALFYLWGCALKPDPDRVSKQGLKQTVLLRSTPQTWFVDANRPRLDDSTMNVPEAKYSGTQTLAVLLEGEFADATEGKPVPPWPDDAQGKPEPAKPLVAKPGRLLVIGAGEIFSDQLLEVTASTRHQNTLFTMSAVEALALSPKLSSIRAKSFKARFIPMAELSRKFWNFLLTTVVLPFILASFGITLLVFRRRRRDEYRRSLEASRP